MCVGFWSLTHSEYALILCSNRDEFLNRPTAAASWHNFEQFPETLSRETVGAVQPSDDAPILSGRDLLAGGTWLGMNKFGHVGFLTNITEAPKPYPLSRGALLSAFLLKPGSLANAVQELEGNDGMFAGFNMLTFAPVPGASPLRYDGRFITDSYGGGAIHARQLRSDELSACGLSNGVDGSGGESYPKVLNGKEQLQKIISSFPRDASDEVIAAALLDMLTSQTEPAPRDAESRKASISVAPISGYPAYGTRVSTAILIRRDGNVLFVERDRWVLDGDRVHISNEERKFRFKISDEYEVG